MIDPHVYQDLLAASAGYVRNAFVLASVNDYAEPEHLEAILLDAIKTEPVKYDEPAAIGADDTAARYAQYHSGDYRPTEHEVR